MFFLKTMKKLNKVAIMIAVAVTVGSAFADGVIGGDDWRNNTDSTVWKNGTDELCWRDAYSTSSGCDNPPPPPPVSDSAPADIPAESVPAPAPVVVKKVAYGADALFDSGKSVLKPEGRAKLDDLVSEIKDINLEVIVAVGHTDSVGSDAYNQRLSKRRAEAVKAYLVSRGVEGSRVYTEGKGKTQPIADNSTAEGRAQNRRVEMEVTGTRAN